VSVRHRPGIDLDHEPVGQNGSPPDLLHHVGAQLDDNAALVLVRALAVWGDQLAQPSTGIGSRSYSVPLA
jgi:hypothetical protein